MFGRGSDPLIPGADVLADIAAKDPIADPLSQGIRNRLTEFDRQVANALAAIEDIRLNKRIGRTGIETGSAGATMVRLVRLVVVEFQIGEQGSQKKTNCLPAG